MKRAVCLILAAMAWLACSANGDKPSGFCNEGETRPCSCSNGTAGVERCNAAGDFVACACEGPPGLVDASVDVTPGCGDGKCTVGAETCRTCARDCGECPKCALAPSCSDAVGVPSNPPLRGDLSQPPVKPDGGTDGGGADAGAIPGNGNTCMDPELRLRVEKVVVYKGGGQIYCIVSATDGASSEAAVTQKTKSLGDNETNFFDPNAGIYWGQKELHRTTNNLTVTFDCFLVKSDAWAKVFKAVGDTSAQLGGTATPYGWAFGLGGLAANAAAAGIQAGAGDDHRFNAQQVIDKKDLLDLTNGRRWSFRQGGGCGLFCNWDWEVYVQSWGCAEGQKVTP